ncbi:hypothetical protein [Arenibacter sp. H213]|nr:hypothetical protein [Arenibacter sp. H213]
MDGKRERAKSKVGAPNTIFAIHLKDRKAGPPERNGQAYLPEYYKNRTGSKRKVLG